MVGVIADWAIGLLCCPTCQTTVEQAPDGALGCVQCNSRFPISNGVPLMLAPDSFLDAAQTIAAASDGLDVDAVAEAVATANRYWLKDPVLRGEFSGIIDRYAGFFPSSGTIVETGRPQVELLAHYFTPQFKAGEVAYRSLRIRNNSTQEWNSDFAQPFLLSYFLCDADGVRFAEGPRSRLPIALKPGHDLTVPVRIDAPRQEGAYILKISLLQEHVRWYDDAMLLEQPIIVSESESFADQVRQVPHEGYFDFEKDIAYCGDVLRDAVRIMQGRRAPGQSVRMVEIACGSDPQTLRHYQPSTSVTALDVCFPQVQLAALRYRRLLEKAQPQFQFVAGELDQSPLTKGQFDIAVISAALHHFADVTLALSQMRDLVAEDGLIILLREPSKVSPDDPTFIQELLWGFNEQQFCLDEYKFMFEKSRLKPIKHIVHFETSYKAILEKLKL